MDKEYRKNADGQLEEVTVTAVVHPVSELSAKRWQLAEDLKRLIAERDNRLMQIEAESAGRIDEIANSIAEIDVLIVKAKELGIIKEEAPEEEPPIEEIPV